LRPKAPSPNICTRFGPSVGTATTDYTLGKGLSLEGVSKVFGPPPSRRRTTWARRPYAANESCMHSKKNKKISKCKQKEGQHKKKCQKNCKDKKTNTRIKNKKGCSRHILVNLFYPTRRCPRRSRLTPHRVAFLRRSSANRSPSAMALRIPRAMKAAGKRSNVCPGWLVHPCFSATAGQSSIALAACCRVVAGGWMWPAEKLSAPAQAVLIARVAAAEVRAGLLRTTADGRRSKHSRSLESGRRGPRRSVLATSSIAGPTMSNPLSTRRSALVPRRRCGAAASEPQFRTGSSYSGSIIPIARPRIHIAQASCSTPPAAATNAGQALSQAVEP